MSKVRANQTHEGMYTEGRIYEVVERACKYNHLYIKTDRGTVCSVTREYFTPVGESELERLVRVANEGDAAIKVLKEKYPNDVIDNEGDPITRYGSTFTFSIKPKPAFEPFTVGSGWTVKLEGETLHIGCKTYVANLFKSDLNFVNSTGTGRNYDLRATRVDVRDKEGHSITWSDADRILAALKKAGIK